MTSLFLDPWGFCVHWKKKGVQLKTVESLQKLLNSEFLLFCKRPLKVNLCNLMTRQAPFLEPCWPDTLVFFGSTIIEALTRIEIADGQFGPYADVKLPNGMSGWIKKSYSPNDWDEKGGCYQSCFQNNEDRIGSFSTLDLNSIVNSWRQPIMGNRWNFNSFVRPKL